MSHYGPLSNTIDFSATGKQIGALWLDYSDDTNAYSLFPISIAVISNGVGPTVLFTAGAHGNEYEGQVALRTIVRQLNVTQVQRRIIVLPSVNMPAVRADSRISTLERGLRAPADI